jgi:hypothetical protein
MRSGNVTHDLLKALPRALSDSQQSDEAIAERESSEFQSVDDKEHSATCEVRHQGLPDEEVAILLLSRR